MAMSSLVSLNLFVTNIIFAFLLLSPTYCLNHKHPPDTTQGLLVEEKTRLGSTPPSCHNKCNLCHPCMAVQVPTMPSHDRVQPHAGRAKTMDYFDSSPSSNSYPRSSPLYDSPVEENRSTIQVILQSSACRRESINHTSNSTTLREDGPPGRSIPHIGK